MSTQILVHGDPDGVCSGALALAANPDSEVFFTNPMELYKDLKEINDEGSVIICDIALIETTLPKVLDQMRSIASKNSILYIDHHPLPAGLDLRELPGTIIHELGACASELTYKAFKKKLLRKASRIAIYGAIGDYADHTQIIQKLIRDWDRRTIYFEAGVLIQGLEGTKENIGFKREIVKLLSENRLPSTSAKLLERAVIQTHNEEQAISEIENKIDRIGEIAYVLDVGLSLSKAATYARALAGASIGIAGKILDGIVDVSLRTERNDLDLNILTREVAHRFRGEGGGHPKASAARIPSASFRKFLEALNCIIEKKP
jgi:single-stranded-DNA-specific exonuclease